MQETSLIAYRKILKKMGRRRAQVLKGHIDNHIEGGRNLSNTELAVRLGWSINRITPRVKELRDRGLLVLDLRRRCKITGMEVMAWKLAGIEVEEEAYLTKVGNYAILHGWLEKKRWTDIDYTLSKMGYSYEGEGVWKLKTVK